MVQVFWEYLFNKGHVHFGEPGMDIFLPAVLNSGSSDFQASLAWVFMGVGVLVLGRIYSCIKSTGYKENETG